MFKMPCVRHVVARLVETDSQEDQNESINRIAKRLKFQSRKRCCQLRAMLGWGSRRKPGFSGGATRGPERNGAP